MNEPKIRFKGFEGEWETSAIGDLASFSKGRGYSKSDLKNNGYPIILYGRMYTDYSFVIDSVDTFATLQKGSVLSNGDEVVIPASGETPEDIAVASAVTMKNVILGGDLNILKFDKNKIFSTFAAMQISCGRTRKELSNFAQGKTVVHLHNSNISKGHFCYPPISEQQSIASFFTSLDSQIQSTTKKIESLKQVKAASLQSMFPQEGETTPRVRIGKRSYSWKEFKLEDFLVERHECSTITPDLPQLSFTIEEGIIPPEDRKSNQRDFLIKDKDTKRYLVTRVGDIIYNPANVVYGAIHRNSLTDGVVSPIYKIFTTNQDSRFIECLVRRPSFINQLAMRTEGTVTKLKTLKPEAFLDMSVFIPTDSEEQRLIGEYFASLDSQITLQTQRLEKLKQIKSACLDSMFV